MVLELDVGILVTVSLAVVAAWWAMAKLFVSQFEARQNERFDNLTNSITSQKHELDSHMIKQDGLLVEIRRIESELSRSQIEAANRYQTKTDAGHQFGQIIIEIRGLGSRIDALHGRNNGYSNGASPQ